MSTTEIENRISELLKELADQEIESRYLRSEVANLERAAILISLPSEAGSNAYGQSSALQVHQDPSGNQMVRAQQASQHGQVHPFMPEEFLDTLSNKREAMLDAQRDYIAQVAEKKRLQDLVARNKEAAESLSTDLEKFYEKAKWRPGATSNYLCPIRTDNENSRLKKKLLEVYQEAQTTQKQMVKQTDQLKALVIDLESMQNVDEENFAAQTDLRLKNGELKAVEDEINSCKRIYQQKEKYLAKVSDHSKDKEQIRQIDADKRVAQKSLIGHKDQARQADAGIRHRALLITLLEERIEIIGEAIRGDASPSASEESSNKETDHSPADVPRVDVQFVDRIRNEVMRLQQQVTENALIIDIADSQLELGEDRVRILERSRKQTEARLDNTKDSHVAFNGVLEAEVGDHRSEVLAKMAYYERCNDELLSKLQEMDEVISAAEASKRADVEQQLMRSVGGSFAAARAATPPPTPSRRSFATPPAEEEVPAAFDRSPLNVRSHSRALSNAGSERAVMLSKEASAEYRKSPRETSGPPSMSQSRVTAIPNVYAPTVRQPKEAEVDVAVAASAPISGASDVKVKQHTVAPEAEPEVGTDAFHHETAENGDDRARNEASISPFPPNDENESTLQPTVVSAPSPTGAEPPAPMEETPAPTPIPSSRHQSHNPAAGPTADESFRGGSVSDVIEDPASNDQDAAVRYQEMSEFKAFGE